jgi:hypothetical protein
MALAPGTMDPRRNLMGWSTKYNVGGADAKACSAHVLKEVMGSRITARLQPGKRVFQTNMLRVGST